MKKNGEQLVGTIPSTIGKLIQLKQLGISHNPNIHGTIPIEITYLNRNQLRYINLGHNQLVGTIPSDIGKLMALDTFILSGNQFNGTIPFDQFAQTSMNYLALDENQFHGPLAESIGNCTELRYLYLNDNSFHGTTIPTTIGNLKHLRSLTLDRTGLVGALPTSISQSNQLEYFSITNNSFTGTIPSSMFQSSTNLQTMNLHTNQFSGPLPDVSQLSLLRKFIAYQNQFSGSITQTFINNDALGT